MAAGMTVARRSTRAKSLTSKIIFVTEATWAICVVYEQDCLHHKALAVLVGADHRGQIPAFLAWRWSAIIHELRVYQPVPGQMLKLLARFRDKLLPIWERHGIRPHWLLDDPCRGIQQ